MIQILEEHLRGHVTVGLVVGIRLVAEGGFRRVEGDGHTLGFQGFACVQKGLEEAVGDAGGAAVLGGQPPFAAFAEGVETAEGQGMAVHKQQQGLGGGLRHDGNRS